MVCSFLDVELAASSLISIAEDYIVCNMAMTNVSSQAERVERIDYVAEHLLSRAALLVRLLVKQVRSREISRTEMEVLSTLTEGPRKITELTELAGIAQPTMTLLVKRLQEKGWVRRAGLPEDGRVVMVSLTRAGSTAQEKFRAQFLAALRVDLQELSDRQLEELSVATETLSSFVDDLQPSKPSSPARPAGSSR
jgi:DNA-binding MarR family transcriptional regulator